MTLRTSVPIQISLVRQGRYQAQISFSPSTAYAQPGDTIEWTGPGPFTVHFPDASPVGKAFLQSDASNLVVSPPVSEGARGKYRYSAAVSIDGRPYVGHSDSVIIEDPW